MPNPTEQPADGGSTHERMLTNLRSGSLARVLEAKRFDLRTLVAVAVGDLVELRCVRTNAVQAIILASVDAITFNDVRAVSARIFQGLEENWNSDSPSTAGEDVKPSIVVPAQAVMRVEQPAPRDSVDILRSLPLGRELLRRYGQYIVRGTEADLRRDLIRKGFVISVIQQPVFITPWQDARGDALEFLGRTIEQKLQQCERLYLAQFPEQPWTPAVCSCDRLDRVLERSDGMTPSNASALDTFISEALWDGTPPAFVTLRIGVLPDDTFKGRKLGETIAKFEEDDDGELTLSSFARSYLQSVLDPEDEVENPFTVFVTTEANGDICFSVYTTEEDE